MYYIWSNEHNMWWCANHRGYTNYLDTAGLYDKKEALEICNKANHGWNVDMIKSIPNELPIHKDIASSLIYKNACIIIGENPKEE